MPIEVRQKVPEFTYSLVEDFHPKGAVAKQFGLYLEDKGITNRRELVDALSALK